MTSCPYPIPLLPLLYCPACFTVLDGGPARMWCARCGLNVSGAEALTRRDVAERQAVAK